jgi:hypothetical protein
LETGARLALGAGGRAVLAAPLCGLSGYLLSGSILVGWLDRELIES